jgi:tRNA(fMet)-specific endonuclease VapC
MNKRPQDVIQKFKSKEVGQIGISSITVSELEYGAMKSSRQKQNLKRLHEFLIPFELLAYDENASKYYGQIRSRLERKGAVIGFLDLLIAAHALSRGFILVSNNDQEFKRVDNLVVENWAA